MELLLGLLPLFALLICASAFFSASETALFSLPSRKGASSAVKAVLEDQRALLITVLLGNMFVNVLYCSLSALAAVSVSKKHGALGFGITSFGAMFCLILLGEVLPKNLALLMSTRIAAFSAPVLMVFERLISPLRRFFDAVTRVLTRMLLGSDSPASENLTSAELEQVVGLGCKRGELGSMQQEFIEELLDLSELRVREIMVPRVEIAMSDIADKASGVFNVAAASRVTKIPVYDRNTDNILGVCHVKDLLINPDADVREILRKPQFVPESMRVEKLLEYFLSAEDSVALVVDEYGTLEGLVTVEDASEEIVGDILDEYDSERKDHTDLGDGRFSVNGSMSCREFDELFDCTLLEEGVSTIAGFVLAKLGHLPKEGETVRAGDYIFTVSRVRAKRIRSVIMERLRDTGKGDLDA